MKTTGSAGASSPYRFWLPPEVRRVRIGPDQAEVPLPLVPLPIKTGQDQQVEPDDVLIGSSVYDYLRQYPDCQYNREYAELLRDAYPHYIADLASQSVMLSHKDVAAAYLQRLVNYLKILLLLDPRNPGLVQQLGIQSYRLAMNFEVLAECRRHLLTAQHYLLAAAATGTPDPATLNYLAHIAYLFGDYPTAGQYWQQIRPRLTDADALALVDARLEELRQNQLPGKPLLDDLEQVGEAMLLYGSGDYDQARQILEIIEEQGDLYRAFPLAEFHYLLGMCRFRTGEAAAAFDSLEQALQIDPDYVAALEAREMVLNQGG